MIVDYEPAKECKNEDVIYTCRKCGKCGRKFENGFMVLKEKKARKKK